MPPIIGSGLPDLLTQLRQTPVGGPNGWHRLWCLGCSGNWGYGNDPPCSLWDWSKSPWPRTSPHILLTIRPSLPTRLFPFSIPRILCAFDQSEQGHRARYQRLRFDRSTRHPDFTSERTLRASAFVFRSMFRAELGLRAEVGSWSNCGSCDRLGLVSQAVRVLTARYSVRVHLKRRLTCRPRF